MKRRSVKVLAGMLAVAVAVTCLPMVQPDNVGVALANHIAEAGEMQSNENVSADGQGNQTGEGDISIQFSDADLWESVTLLTGSTVHVGFDYTNLTSSPVELRISSSNTEIIEVQTSSMMLDTGYYGHGFGSFVYKPKSTGMAELILTVGGKVYTHKIYVLPPGVDISSVEQSGYQSVTVKWEKAAGCNGYRVERLEKGNTSDWRKAETVATVDGDQDSAEVTAKWGVPYIYRVVGFIRDGAESYEPEYFRANTYEFTTGKISSEITSITKSGSKLKIEWNMTEGATAYKLYRSTEENGSYQCIGTLKSDQTSYTQQVKKGVAYYYKLVTVYPEGESDFSRSVSRLIPAGGKAGMVSCGLSDDLEKEVYYYQSGGKLYMVNVKRDGRLIIYTLNASLKVEKKKTVKLKYDRWGGFYKGVDGNFYVVVGYYNPKESRSKVVIEVIQYNSNWKKLKTAKIKGNATNAFEGIQDPFHSGNCQMDMQGHTLYLMTARTMFKHSDGLNHQSNIAFKIDTKTMKASNATETYVSHSFNQFVKFKDGSLYLLNHGDAYPRALELAMVDHYGTKDQTQKRDRVFSFQGKTGDNFTGCQVGGMEVGENNVVICGIAQPHNKKVKGISGFDNRLAYNLFLATTDRKTGKTAFKWLTKYNPKKTNVRVQNPCMVKLADDRFAILYTTTQKEKTKLNYLVVNDSGEKIYSKTYSNLTFGIDSCQPILYNGNIVWADYELRWTYNPKTKMNEYDPKMKIGRIPARY